LTSSFSFSAEQAAVIRSLGVEPVTSTGRWWMHDLDPRRFRRPALA
jgi:hypothetical protein